MVIDIFNEKRKCFSHLCPDSVYFHKLLLISYFSASIESLICRREMSVIGSTSFGFAQNTIHDFQHTVLTHSGIVFDKSHKNGGYKSKFFVLT